MHGNNCMINLSCMRLTDCSKWGTAPSTHKGCVFNGIYISHHLQEFVSVERMNLNMHCF